MHFNYEPRREETGLRFPTRSDINGSVLSQKTAIAINYGFEKRRDCTFLVAKTKALICCAVTAQLICVFVFT